MSEPQGEVVLDIAPCSRCGEHPPREAYQCRGCGKIPDEHPFPILGCRCVANTFLCEACLGGTPTDSELITRNRTA